jgi:phosphoglycolate phosphatase
MPYKLAIFDFDGTLADSIGWMKGVFNELAEHFHFPTATPEELDALRQRDNKAILAHFGIPLWKMPSIAMHVRKLAARDADRIQLYPGITELLAALEAKGLTLAVVSSNSEENVRRVLGPQSAARIRHYACGASLFGKRSKFRAVLKRSGISSREAIAIGDEVRDIEAAAAEGIDTGAVTWGYASPDVLRAHAPTAVFTTLDALLLAVAP